MGDTTSTLHTHCNTFVTNWLTMYIITVRNSTCGKVMFLHLSVVHSVHRGVHILLECILVCYKVYVRLINTSDTPENSRDWSPPVANTGFSVKELEGAPVGTRTYDVTHFLKTGRNQQNLVCRVGGGHPPPPVSLALPIASACIANCFGPHLPASQV